MALINDFASRFRKGLSNPFTPMEAGSMDRTTMAGKVRGKESYCKTCKLHVTTNMQWAHRHSTYVFRLRCDRCGNVVEGGASDCVSVLGVRPDAVKWTQEKGEDRR